MSPETGSRSCEILKLVPQLNAVQSRKHGSEKILTEERVIGETNAWNDMASCESSLLGLREILINVAVEFELANIPNWYEFFGPDFGRIEDVEVKIMFL